ncbi:uncharacterized protein LOC5525267 [Nematostella vectensis]|uniref:uncharacterized protein LOC5525267 n=1 Tax=Nematostella vectensis TaxID=45351 RepID=UPI0020779358|nr:uncharacterized protein LOC5525267 [Nematostella vectensis]
MSKESARCLERWEKVDRKTYVPLTKAHLKFVAKATRYPLLIDGCYLENAVRRYEKLWLPLCRRHGTMSCDEWAAPLDVAWVWILHMLSPTNYRRECSRLIKNPPNHRSKSGEDLEQALRLSRRLWVDAYPREPFEVNLSVPIAKDSFITRIRYDFNSASIKYSEFCYQVSLPHFCDDNFLNVATQRYVRYLDLQSKRPNVVLRPPLDIKLILHSHQLNPIFYASQSGVILGAVQDIDLALSEACEDSRRAFECEGIEYARPGIICRERQPLKTHPSPVIHPQAFASVVHHIEITEIRVSHLNPEITYMVTLEVENRVVLEERILAVGRLPRDAKAARRKSGLEYVPLHDLRSEGMSMRNDGSLGFVNPLYQQRLVNEQEKYETYEQTIGDGTFVLTSFQIDTSHTTSFSLSLYETANSVFTTRKALVGLFKFDTLKHLGRYGESMTQSTDEDNIILSAFLPDKDLALNVSCKVSPKEFGDMFFTISPDFGLKVFYSLSKALSRACVAENTNTILTNPAEVTMYPVCDQRGELAFNCRIIRSVPDTDQIIVEILDSSGAVCATSSLLNNGVLPRKGDVSKVTDCAFLEPCEGDHAMLIRGEEDWGILMGRKVCLHGNQAQILALKLFLMGKGYCYVRKYRDWVYLIDLAAGACVLVDLERRRVIVSRSVSAVAQAVALCFSVLILRYLSCKHDRESWVVLGENGIEVFTAFQSPDEIGAEWNGLLARVESGREYHVSETWGNVTL